MTFCGEKNYEKKKCKEQKEAYREIHGIVHNAMMKHFCVSREFKEKESEVFNSIMGGKHDN